MTRPIPFRFMSAPLAAIGLIAAVAPALAQDLPGQPSAARGEVLANKSCLVCHIPKVPTPGAPVKVDVPTFPEIAMRQDAAGIKAMLINPRHPMPQIQLTQAEMDDIAAYVLAQKPAQ
ncbi:MAG: c-type cytochrome [Pseudomonadota bacterium]|nr:c-type cytochrome [Pseudomonadota bacterium]